MTNYYEELNLDRSLGITEINIELNKQERVWIQREVNNPEKAKAKLTLIFQARNVFRSAATRAEYDQALNESNKAPKSEAENRSESIRIWFHRAKEYYDTKQYDLAKAAIEKTISYSVSVQDDAEMCALAADIYCKNNNTSVALEYINKAIIIHPEVADYFIKKGLIFEKIAQQNKAANRHADAHDSYRSMQKMLELAITKAQSSGDKYAEGVATGTLAFALYYFLNDKEKAEKIAKDTVDNKNDSWGNARRVLDDITEKRHQEAKALEEQKLRQEQQAKALQAKKEQQLATEREQKHKNNLRKLFHAQNIICGIVFLLWEIFVLYCLFKNNAYHNLRQTINIYLIIIGVWNMFGAIDGNSIMCIIVPFALFGGFLAGTNTEMSWGFVGRKALVFLIVILVFRLMGVFIRKVLKLKG